MFWDIFVDLCVKNKKKPTPVVTELGFSSGSVTNWKKGATPSEYTLKRVAKYFGVSVDYLLGNESKAFELRKIDNIFPLQLKKIPMLGEIACGKPIFANEDRESYVIAGTDVKADFCLQCKGDSMINARIHDGDIVFIRQQPMVNNGEIAAVIIDDTATLKRVFYYPDKGKLVLQAENPNYEPLVYVGEELNTIRILGKAIAFQSDIK